MSTMTLDSRTLDSRTINSRPARAFDPRQPRTGPRGRLRLTRRGRVLVVLVALVLLVVGISAGQVASQASSHDAGPAKVTVQPGESLWQVATRIAPHTDPRLVVSQLEQANHLPTAAVFAGQQLIVPR